MSKVFDCGAVSQREYLLELLDNAGAGIAVYPSRVVSGGPPPAPNPEDPSSYFYFYRPGQLLVRTDKLDLFWRFVKDRGAREPRISSADYTRPDAEAKDGYSTQPANEIGVTRVFVEDVEVDGIITELEKASGGELIGMVTPNHVIFGCQHWIPEPCGDPSTADHGPRTGGEGRGIIVAVVDSGLPDNYHLNPILPTAKVETIPADLEPFGYQGNPGGLPEITFPQGHGTFVAGVVRQAAALATVRSYRALDIRGATDEWTLGNQIYDVLQARPAPDVINLSLGTFTRGDLKALGLQHLGANSSPCAANGPIVVAAAGNFDLERPFWPAAEPWAISVGAAERYEDGWRKACFSNWGCWVDVCANGVDVLSSYPSHLYQRKYAPGTQEQFDKWATWSGTSFAAPLVSGVVADWLGKPGHSGQPDALVYLKHLRRVPLGGGERIGPLVPAP